MEVLGRICPVFVDSFDTHLTRPAGIDHHITLMLLTPCETYSRRRSVDNANRRLYDIGFELIPQECYHLVKALVRLFQGGARVGRRATERPPRLGGAVAEAPKLGAYGNLGIGESLVDDHVPNECML